MAEYVRFTPEGPWHRFAWLFRWERMGFTLCQRTAFGSDEFSDTPGDYLCKECDRG